MDWLQKALPKREPPPQPPNNNNEPPQAFPTRPQTILPMPTVASYTNPAHWNVFPPSVIQILRDPPKPPEPKVTGIDTEPVPPYEPKRSRSTIFPTIRADVEVGPDTPPFPPTYGIYNYKQPPDPREGEPAPPKSEWWRSIPTFEPVLARQEATSKFQKSAQLVGAVGSVVFSPVTALFEQISKFLSQDSEVIKEALIPFYDYNKRICWPAIVDGAIAGAVMGFPLGLGMTLMRFQRKQRWRRWREKGLIKFFKVPKQRLEIDMSAFSQPVLPKPSPYIKDLIMGTGRITPTKVFAPMIRMVAFFAFILGMISGFGACTEFHSDPYADLRLPQHNFVTFQRSDYENTLPKAKKFIQDLENLAKSKGGFSNKEMLFDPAQQYGPLDGGEAVDDWLEAWDYDLKPDYAKQGFMFYNTYRSRVPAWAADRGWARDRWTESPTLRRLEDTKERLKWEKDMREKLERNRLQRIRETGEYYAPVDLYDAKAIDLLPEMASFPREFLPSSRILQERLGKGNFLSPVDTPTPRPIPAWWETR